MRLRTDLYNTILSAKKIIIMKGRSAICFTNCAKSIIFDIILFQDF
jgi:hypothetical protein